MKKYYFTFGFNHVHTVNGITFDKDIIIEIEADNCVKARSVMFKHFNEKWGMCYYEMPDMKFYPRGIYNLTKKEWVKI